MESTVARQPEARAALDALCAEYWAFRLRESPSLGLMWGDDRHPGQLDRESVDDYSRRHAVYGDLLRRAEALPACDLVESDATTRDALVEELRRERARYALGEHLEPLLYPFGPQVALPMLPTCVTLADAEQGEAWLERLAQVPRVLDEFVERLEIGAGQGRALPAVLKPRVLAAAEGCVAADTTRSPWLAPFDRVPGAYPAARREAHRRRAAGIAGKDIRPAFERFATFVEHRLPTRASVSVCDGLAGEEYYRFLIETHVGPGCEPESIHALGLEEVGRIEAEQREQQAALGMAGDLGTFLRGLAVEPRLRAASGQELLEKARALSKKVDGAIPRFFGRIPRMTYGVEAIPLEAAAGLPPAYAQPSPADGRRPGVHWVTPLTERCQLNMLVPLALHEAWPGHLMHAALMNELDHLPAFRRFGMMNATAYVEGWALYCERLGIEMGLYQTPEDHLGRLDMEMWRALRLVVDTGLHAMGWTREQAIACMRAHSGLPAHTIESEVDRYIGMPAQALAYKIGERKILGLRRRAEERLAGRFDLREFHDRLMDCGPVSLALLERHVEGWLARVASA